MQKKTNIYAWLGLVSATMLLTGCPDVKLGGGDAADAGMHDHDHDHDGGMHAEEHHDGGMHVEDHHDGGMAAHDAGMEEIDDCTADEAGDEMTDDTNMDWTCAPQEDEDMCFNEEYDWEERCANEGCVDTGALCFRHPDSLWFNECLEANSITAYCDDGVGHEQDEDGPVIHSISYDSTGTDSACGDTVTTFTASVYDSSGNISTTGSDLYNELNLLDQGELNAGNGWTFDLPSITDDGDGFYSIEFTLCTSSAEGEGDYAVYLEVDGNASNAYCFTNGDMPSDAWTYANNNDLGDLYEAPEDCEPSE